MVSIFVPEGTVARVNIVQRVKTSKGWSNVPLKRTPKGRIRWPSGGRYFIEWRENGRRLRQSAGDTPSEALEAQKRKRFQLEATDTGFEIVDVEAGENQRPLATAVDAFLKDIKTFRKPLTHQKYAHILQLFTEYAAPKSDVREITGDDIKNFLAWRKSKGFDPGTTLYTDRVILHNFFNKLGIDNPVKDVPRLARLRKRPAAYTNADLKKFFAVCDDWERAFFTLALSTGLRRGELQTLHWSDLDLVNGQVDVRAKPQYGFLPKDWEERTVPFSKEVAATISKHSRTPNCSLVFPSPKSHLNYRFLHDRCKHIATRAGLDPQEWHLHRFRDTAATRWLRAGIDIRTVQMWLGHESLATTQKYLEPSKETARQLNRMKLPF
jgi:integrase/recombinase XerD